MNSHLVAVEVSVECRTNGRMDLDRFTVNKHRLECLDAKAVKRRSSVQKDRMLADHFFQNVPNDRLLPLYHFTRLFDGGGVLVAFKLVVDERLEQLESHLLGQTALVKFQLRANDDHRTSRVINTLSEQILAEASLFSFERSRKRFQWAIIRTAKHSAATTVVKQRIDRFLQHALFVSDD